MPAQWNDDLTAAVLFDERGDLKGWLRAETWYARRSREPEIAWSVSFIDDAPAEHPMMVAEEVECPARPAETPERRETLAARAFEIWSGVPRAAQDEFFAAVRAGDDERGRFLRWERLSELLFWTYALDEVLQTTWNALPPERRVWASQETDSRAEAVIARNKETAARHGFSLDQSTEAALAAYRRRKEARQPYEHWSSLLLAGRFSEDFFRGLQWVRGKLTHVGVAEPIELRQLRAGGEPRWKWKPADAVALPERGRGDPRRQAYANELAEQDVVGLFGWLIDVFVDAQRQLVQLWRESERDTTHAAEGRPRLPR